MKIYCFGNLLIKEDRVAVELARKIKIKGVKFVYCSDPLELLNAKEDEIFIMDAANVKEVVVTSDLEILKERKLTSLHDFDLNFTLRLLKKIKPNVRVTLILVPMNLLSNT